MSKRTELAIRILLELQAKGKVTAKDMAAKYDVSERTVFRPVDELSVVVPIVNERGRNGGIVLKEKRL